MRLMMALKTGVEAEVPPTGCAAPMVKMRTLGAVKSQYKLALEMVFALRMSGIRKLQDFETRRNNDAHRIEI